MGFFTKTMTLAAASCLAATLTFAPANAADKKINIGWTAWSDAEAVTTLAKKILEDRMGYKVEVAARTSGPINAILLDHERGTMWGGSSDHGEDYGIGW